MADDTPTVAQATDALWVAVLGDRDTPTLSRYDANRGIAAAIDALIAAVRAERAQELGEAYDALIAYRRRYDPLNDADVDAYLAEVTALPADPERVERIRRLFLDKLKG